MMSKKTYTSVIDGKQKTVATSRPRDPWPKVNVYCLHGHKTCKNPSQCYCSCHRVETRTDKQIEALIVQHKVEIARLEAIIERRKV